MNYNRDAHHLLNIKIFCKNWWISLFGLIQRKKSFAASFFKTKVFLNNPIIHANFIYITLHYAMPRLHLVAPPNITLGVLKRNLRHVITITPPPSDIKRKEMRRNSQKHFRMLRILAVSLYLNWSIADRATAYQPTVYCTVGLDVAIYALLRNWHIF